jgi:hypothetical protein
MPPMISFGVSLVQDRAMTVDLGPIFGLRASTMLVLQRELTQRTSRFALLTDQSGNPSLTASASGALQNAERICFLP